MRVCQAVWRATYRVTARWNKKRNPAIAVGGKATSYVFPFRSQLRFYPFSTVEKKSRAIALRLGVVLEVVVLADTAPAEEEAAQDKNVIAVERWAILRVRALRHRAVGLEEVGIAVVEEAEEVGMAVSAVGTKRRGAYNKNTPPAEALRCF